MEHLDLGGNSLFINDCSFDSISEAINLIANNHNILARMTEVAKEKGPIYFAYSNIAKKAIGINKSNLR